ncbi:MAG: LysM peptidoglycan-binding domain-containing protein [Spirochaetaceae bacterium]|jgi:nucleoid-associated protein YgaU|nr:LysM peptidoglycan-binding domain-containing protein [Spirochaetaceae bacterium]
MKLHFFLLLLLPGFFFLGAQDLRNGELQTAEQEPAASSEEEAQSETAFSPDEQAEAGLLQLGADGEGEFHIPASLKNNRYYLDSLRFSNLARLSFNEGDYDQSAWYSSEAARLARLSDEYISEKLKFSRAIAKLKEAEERVDWADTNNVKAYYPKEVAQAHEDLNEASSARRIEDWDRTIEYSDKTIDDLADVAAPPPKGKLPDKLPKLPTQYKVRPWDEFGDCFWNISKWFYGTPWYWPLLYRVNKHKLPNPENPNLIEIGTVLDIPSVTGEIRVGMYDTGIQYKN